MRLLLLCCALSCTPTKTESDEPNDTQSLSAPQEPTVSSGDDDEIPEDCETTMGTIEGQILFDPEGRNDPVPAEFSHVIATPSTGDPITISSDEQGRFSTPLPADNYLLMAEGWGCTSDQLAVEIIACERETHTLRLVTCLEGGLGKHAN